MDSGALGNVGRMAELFNSDQAKFIPGPAAKEEFDGVEYPRLSIEGCS